MPPLGPAQVGPYVLKQTLGTGSTGHVRLAVHFETHEPVAIKIISKELLNMDKDLHDKVEREIAILKLIKHPHVLMLYDVYESDHSLYLVLEYVEGGEMFDYLSKKGRLSLDEALRFFQQIISAVDYCHHHYICHRDLKPENLLLDRHGHLKIADFGMASLQHRGMLLDQSCGSPHYASPEIIRGIKYDGRAADVWSCGVILYALLTGCLPFDDENITRLLTKVKVGAFRVPDHVPGEVQMLLRRMMAVNPNKRFTMEEVKRHVWVQSNSMMDTFPTPPTYDDLPALSPDEILDEDVLLSMRRLGCFDQESELRKALTSPTSNVEKIMYFLLLERKVVRPAVADDYVVESAPPSPAPGETIVKRTDSTLSMDSGYLQKTLSLEGGGLLSRRTSYGPSDGMAFERSASCPHHEITSYLHPPDGRLPSRLSSLSSSARNSMPHLGPTLEVPSHGFFVGEDTRDSSPPVSPKRSWFGSLFHQKDAIRFESGEPLETLVTHVTKVLETHHVECTPAGPGTIRCRFCLNLSVRHVESDDPFDHRYHPMHQPWTHGPRPLNPNMVHPASEPILIGNGEGRSQAHHTDELDVPHAVQSGADPHGNHPHLKFMVEFLPAEPGQITNVVMFSLIAGAQRTLQTLYDQIQPDLGQLQ